MDFDIACSLCHQEYSQSNPPRSLICGHSYCQLCLSNLLQDSKDPLIITCPEDEESTKLKQGIEGLPKNIALMKYIESKPKSNTNSSDHSIKDASLQVSKINKQEYNQQDDDAKELISAMLPYPPEAVSSLVGKQQVEKQQKEAILTENIQKSQRLLSSEEQAEPEENEDEICQFHRRPIDVVCLCDLERCCSKCALFGTHKGHEFKSIEEIERQNEQYFKELMKLSDQKSSIIGQISGRGKLKQITDCVVSKGNNLKKEVQDKFTAFYDDIKNAEQTAIKKIEEYTLKIKDKIEKRLDSDNKVIKDCEFWQLRALQAIKQAQDSHDLNLKFYKGGKEMISQGITKITLLHQEITNDLLQVHRWIDEFKINTQQQNFKKYLEQIVEVVLTDERKTATVQKQNENIWSNLDSYNYEPIKRQRHESDQSLLEFDQFELNSMNTSIAASKILDESFLSCKKTENYPLNSKNKERTHIIARPKPANSAMLNMTKLQTSTVVGKDLVKKKLRGLKVPQKYQKTIEGIMNDNVQLVDLTNAELGDSIVLQIIQMMKNSTRIKTLKLIRNKLSDECIIKILPYLRSVVTLNIAQNQITQSVLMAVAEQRAGLPALRTVIVSQTKIQERKSKGLIERLKKMDLNVTL